tara:strand:+ start:51 stop:521 length:471 start_codon:yes stop_codon:yes gene_type:complete
METTTQDTKAARLADILAGSFETRERQSGGTFHALKDSAPEWVREAVRRAHGERLPCDWIYQQCDLFASDIRQAIVHGYSEPLELWDNIIIEADVYTASLTAWLADHLDNLEYVREWIADFGGSDPVAMISGGQYLAKQTIAHTIIAAYLHELETN